MRYTLRVMISCLVLTLAPAAHAATVWCSLEDGNQRLGFVSELRHEADIRAPHLRRLASRFRRVVNERYAGHFTSDSGICHGFPNPPKAEEKLATVRAGFQARGFRLTTIGVF